MLIDDLTIRTVIEAIGVILAKPMLPVIPVP